MLTDPVGLTNILDEIRSLVEEQQGVLKALSVV
jgi:hypothetical protein